MVATNVPAPNPKGDKLPEGVVRRLIELSSYPGISRKYGIKVLTEAIAPKLGSLHRTMLYVETVIEYLARRERWYLLIGSYSELLEELSGIYLTLLELSGAIALDRETKPSD